MPKRRWADWPRHTMDELNSISGIVGLGGIVLGGAGAIATAPLLFGAGIALVGGAVVYSSVRAYPERLTEPDEVIGQTLNSISELENLAGDIPRIGIVGPSKTGKSTLVEKLKREAHVPDATSSVYAVVLKSGGQSPMTFALLDGAGEEYQQQFAVVAESNSLFLVLDHNESEDEAAIKAARRVEHENFANQVIPFLRSRESRVNRIYIYLNKHDNWKRSTNYNEFIEWGEDIKHMFSGIIAPDQIAVRPHSNWRIDDINLFWNELEASRN